MKTSYIYILASKARGMLYIGVSNFLERRFFEHQNAVNPKSFMARHNVKQVVYYEETCNNAAAIAREKHLKNWHRQWKINLVESVNLNWKDLARSYRMDVETSSA